MKTLPEKITTLSKGVASTPLSAKVCMHVLGTVRSDVRVMRAASALVEAGFSVSIVDIERDSTRPAEENIRGVEARHVISPGWYASKRFKPWFLVKTVETLIRSTIRLIRTPVDIYHAHDVTALPACYIAARLRRKPLIFDAHELPLSEEANNTRWQGVIGLGRYLIKGMVSYCAGIITVSSPIAREIRNSYHRSDVTLIRNILPYQAVPKSDRLQQQLGLSPDIRIALYQGNLQPDRELDKLIHSAVYLERNILIVLMGKGIGTTQSELEDLIAREGLADRVKIIPPVPYAELLDWTSSADIGLTIYRPSRSLNTQLCLPNKIFEYLMAGVPILSSPLDAVVDILKTYDVGQVVSSLTPADVGAAIKSMLADPAALARMRSNALNAARNDLCWEKESRQLIRLYNGLLCGPRYLEVHDEIAVE